jgi:hypothetical protein
LLVNALSEVLSDGCKEQGQLGWVCFSRDFLSSCVSTSLRGHHLRLVIVESNIE